MRPGTMLAIAVTLCLTVSAPALAEAAVPDPNTPAPMAEPEAVAEGSDHDDEEIQTTRGHSRPIYSESITEEYRVPTDHGTIYGTVTRPVVPDDVLVPVILTYSPYNIGRRQTHPSPTHVNIFSQHIPNFYVPRGYAYAEFDLVGTHESSGCYDFGGIAERETGAAVVDFLGSREWSNGKVGMVGASYDGTTAYSAAIETPEHLTTIVPQVAIDRWYDYAYHGGVRRSGGSGTPLLFDFGFGFTPPLNPTDPLHYADVAADRVNPCRRVEHQIRGFGYDPVYDDFWDERDYRARVANVTASVLVEGGWLDRNVSPVGSVRFFEALPDDHPKKMVMGHWAHTTPQFSDWNDVRHAWFDYWLLGYDGTGELPDTGVMDLPRVDSESNTRQRTQTDHWPPEDTEVVDVPLVLDDPAPGELGLVGDDPSYRSEPTLHAANACGPVIGCVGGVQGLTFRSEPFDTDVRISGAPLLDLAARTLAEDVPRDRLHTRFIVTLLDEAPGGSRQTFTVGMLNSRNRDGLDVSTDHAHGEAYRGPVDFIDVDRVVAAGHRLVLRIVSEPTPANQALLPNNELPHRNEVLLDGETVLQLPVSRGHTALAAGS